MLSLDSAKATSFTIDGNHEIDLSEIRDRVLSGEIILVSQCMQAVGFFEPMREASFEGIRSVAGAEKEARVREVGFEKIHDVIDLDELTPIMNASFESHRSLASPMARAVVQDLFRRETPFYYEDYPNVRYHIPFDMTVKRASEFAKWSGKITAHCPHHDSWYDCPTNAFNVWIALGRIQVGNGLTLFPDVYGSYLPCTEDGHPVDDQHFGRPLNIPMQPGDALIFHGEHFHSSEINSTDETRHVVSLRMTFDEPEFLAPSPHAFVRSGSSELQARVNHIATKVGYRVKSLANRIVPKAATVKYDDSPREFPKLLPVQVAGATPEEREQIASQGKDLAIGEIRPISESLCVVRVDEKRAAVFTRQCPHEAGDLAGGTLQGEKVLCPLHNLPIDLGSGKSPCATLAPLKTAEIYDLEGA